MRTGGAGGGGLAVGIEGCSVLAGLSLVQIALMMLAGVALDLLLGEPSRWHPLVGFGRWAAWIEARLNRGNGLLLRGFLAWLIVVVPLTVLIHCVTEFWLTALINTGLLYLCIGLRSLRDHTLPIYQAIEQNDLPRARQLTARIVSRDTSSASVTDLAKASTESLLENGNDAVFATLFWFMVGGGTGAVLYRLANTLDAMWGYRTARFNLFGRSAARIDDVLNWIPARLTALSYVLLAAPRAAKRQAWRCWIEQAPRWSSPNAGPVMSSGAGALGLALGGDAIYDGLVEHRPLLGAGRAPQSGDILRAWHLVCGVTTLWLVTALVLGVVMWGRA
jgi:adenosylcobinamide-phosphate synthase